MRKRTSREERESSLVSGWIVSGDEEPAESGVAAAGGASTEVDEDRAAGAAGPADGRDPAGTDPESADPEGAGTESADTAGELSNGALVLLGVLGGLYLLYAWIWLSWAQFYSEANAALNAGSGSLGSVLQQILFWAAPAAPILWFLAALLMNRGAGMRRVALWLVIGAVVLLPYPIFSGGRGVLMAGRIIAWVVGLLLTGLYASAVVAGVGNAVLLPQMASDMGLGITGAGWFWLGFGIGLPVVVLAAALLLGRGRSAAMRVLLLAAGIGLVAAVQLEVMHLVPQSSFFA